MWFYAKKDLSGGWELENLHQRVSAAQQLGFEVLLEASNDGLKVIYREKIATPYFI